MESPNLMESESLDSDLDIPSEQKKIKERNPLSSTRSTWKSRRDCIQAYFCFLMSFANGLHFGVSIGKYGFLIFIPYVIYSVFVGMPAVLVEVVMSRYVMGDTAKAWNMCPLTKGVMWSLVGTAMIGITNNYIYSVYLIKYFFLSVTDRLKWSTCDDTWAKANCYIVGKKTDAVSNCMKNHSKRFCLSLDWETSGAQFWKHEIGDKTSLIQNISFIFCLLASIFFTVIIIFKDIQSLEKMQILLVIFPIILGTILIFVSFSIPEALLGLKELCNWHWNWLFHPEIWIEGLQNTILFFGLGDLSLTLVSSHGEFSDNIFLDVVVIICGGFFFCFFLMIPVLSVTAGLGAKPTDEERSRFLLFKDIEEVFTSIADAVTLYPFPNTLWSALTYLNCFLMTTSAQTILILGVCDILVGIMNYEFFYVMVTFLIFSMIEITCLMFFGLEFVIDLGSMALTIIVLFTITWQLFYGIHKFNYDFFFMMGYPLPFFVKCSWFTLLTVTLTVLILKIYNKIPDKPVKYICYAYVGAPFVIYFISFLTEIADLSYKGEKIYHVFLPNPNWGPENPLLKESRIILASGNVNREFMYRQELNKKPFKKPPNFSEQNIVQLI